MAEQTPKTKSRAGSRITVPKGLDELVFTCRVPKDAIDLERMKKELGKTTWFDVSPKGVIHGSSTTDSRLEGFHAHFTADGVSEEGETRVFMSYSLHANPPKRAKPEQPKDGVTVFDLPALVGRFLAKPDERLGGVLSTNFVLDRKHWAPTIPLPFDVPSGPFAHATGGPQIAGVDFSFRDIKEQPISRAFVSTYTDEVVVRILSHFAVSFGPTFNREIIDEGAKHLPIFAQPVKGTTSGE